MKSIRPASPKKPVNSLIRRGTMRAGDATSGADHMPYTCTLRGERFVFADLRELFARANEEKSGDQLAGIAARSERERVAAKRKLADLTLDEIVRRPLIDPSDDDVTRLILDTFDQEAFRSIASMTVGEFREFLLDDTTTEAQIRPLQNA